MTSNVQPQPAASNTAAPGMRGEIAQKWDKFSATEIAAIKDTDDLVSQVQTKYGLDKSKAQSEVDAFAKGRLL
ncbi:MAG: hypothetical protein NW216_01945 [Hyphomicrobium sp.]|nr:hypothetical protein [Hyphomicrobium sp.]